ncbi:MAG: nitroreductase family protein [Candidatus Methanofastidiosia archaeon]|jgi:nitroreductase
MELDKAICNRRSIRSFQNKEIPDKIINKMITAATWAPSEGNLQSWRFYVVINEDIKSKLAIAALDQMFISEAPVVIVVCIDLSVISPYGKRGKELYAIQSTAAATENMLLTAHALGVGACWVGSFDEERVRNILGISSRLRPVVLIPVGYPAENSSPPDRTPVDEVTTRVK